jgi:hypothetical protein
MALGPSDRDGLVDLAFGLGTSEEERRGRRAV